VAGRGERKLGTVKVEAFYRTVVMDQTDFLDELLALFEKENVRFCVIGGQGVNAFVEPLVSLDLDLVVAADDVDRVSGLLSDRFRIERFPHSLNVGKAGSDLRVQIQTDPRYFDFVMRSSRREVLGRTLPVASVEDVLRGKVWALSDMGRRPSKRQKDLADVARLLEAFPHLRSHVPDQILARLLPGS
jgi:hypothetical protein